jgi:dipeptidyl aminopeptidase/acylaminoacyl peptidase
MIRTLTRVGLLAGVLLCVAARAEAPPIPAAAFAALPQVSDVVLSPDGQLLAWCDRSGPDAKVVAFDLAAKTYKRTLPVDPTLKVRSLLWADSGTLLVELSQAQDRLISNPNVYEMYRTMAVDIASGQSRLLLMGEGEKAMVTAANLVAWHTTQPHTVVMATDDYTANAERSEIGTRLVDTRGDSGWIRELFRVDTRTGKGTVIDAGDQYSDQWAVDEQGEPVARSEWRPAQSQFLIEVKHGGGWQRIFEGSSELRLWGLSADGKSVIVTGAGKDGRFGVSTVALDGSGSKDLVPDSDVIGISLDSFSGLPVAAELGGLEPQIRWLDDAAKLRHESLARAFGGREIVVSSRSEDGSRLVVRTEGPSNPPVYYMVDFKTHRADIVGESYPGLDGAKLGTVRSITYQARDGATIPAFLTLPPGASPKSLPMVVLPHGGPAAHDDPGFDWLSQFLAVRGYAVLRPQFRGSTGYGAAFERAGERQWGGLMQDDVTDGVQAMIAQGIADPRRVCIVGASYGGYAALAGVAFTPALYACAVSIDGLSDLPAFLTYEQQSHKAYGSESDAAIAWEREIGSPSEQSVIDHSPVNSADKIRVPVLLLHATDDSVVPIEQSQEMADALARLGKPVTFDKLPGDDHWLSRPGTRLTVLQDIDQFLHQYLK